MKNIEYIDIFDSNNQATWKNSSKEEAHKLWLRHRTIQIRIYNKKWEILIQRRSKNKKLYPDKWDISITGHINQDEDILFSAIRKTEETFWLQFNLSDFTLHDIYKDQNHFDNIINNEFIYVYLVKYDDINNAIIDKNKTKNIKFINLNQLQADLMKNSDNYVPYWNLRNSMIETIKDKLKNNL